MDQSKYIFSLIFSFKILLNVCDNSLPQWWPCAWPLYSLMKCLVKVTPMFTEGILFQPSAMLLAFCW